MADLRESEGFQTKTALRTLLESAGLAPRKRYGQHFLIDRNLLCKLVEAAELRPSDCVLEVGAGTGSLTGVVAPYVGHVVAVEIDDQLAAIAQQQLSACPNITLVRGDALGRKSALAEEVETALRAAQAACRGQLKLVANLPYDIATPLVIDLLLGTLPFERLGFTVQTEVADRFLAEPDTSDYGPVGIITQLLCHGRRVAKVPPQAFWPKPKVSSTMVRLDQRPPGEVAIADPPAFAQFVRAFFQHRRKMIGHIARHFDDAAAVHRALEQTGLSPNARPENLTVEQWIQFYQHRK